MLTLPLLCVLACRAPEVPQPNHFARYLWGVAAAQIADNVTTQLAMAPYVDADGRVVAHDEINPILSRDRGANALAQAGATVLTLLVLHTLEPKHPRLARGLAIGLTALGAADAVRNLRLLPRTP